MKILEYDLLTANDPEELIGLVDKSIQKGWQPLGGVAVSLSESDDYRYIIFAQAMVLYGFATPPSASG